jgi:hypothetical protein
VVGEADAVAEQRPVRERRRGVDGDDADSPLLRPHVADECREERGLADARRARHSDRVRASRLRIEVVDDVVGERVAVLDQRDRACERAFVALADAGGERLARPLAAD